MYTRNLFFIMNDPNLEEDHLQNKLDDPDYEHKPFELPNDNFINDLLNVISEDAIIIDMYDFFSKPIKTILLSDYENIDKSTITEEWKDSDHNIDKNYGAIRNLESRMFPIEYMYQQIILSTKEFDEDGNAITGNPDGYDLNNTLKSYDISQYYPFWIQFFFDMYMLKYEPDHHYNIQEFESKVRPAIKEVVNNFYTYVMQLFHDKYTDPDKFYILIEIIRDFLIPKLLECFIAVIKQYDNSQYIESTILTVLQNNYVRMNFLNRFYYLQPRSTNPNFKNIIILNSFINIQNMKKYNLESKTDNIFYIKSVDLDKYDNGIQPQVKNTIPGFCNSIHEMYSLSKEFNLFLPYDSNGIIDEINQDQLKLAITFSKNNQYNYNIIKKSHGIINYNINSDLRKHNITTFDNLDNISNKHYEYGDYDRISYLMLDDVDRDKLDDYLENNQDSIKQVYMYLDLDKLNLSLDDEDDLKDYTDHVKSYDCVCCALITKDKLTSFEQLQTYYKYFNKICIINNCDYQLHSPMNIVSFRVETFLNNTTDSFYNYLFFVNILLKDSVYHVVYSY